MTTITATPSKTQAMLTIAVSSRALFDLEEEHKIFETEGEKGFNRYMVESEKAPLERGAAFEIVRKLLALNTDDVKRVEVVLLSRNSPAAGLRVMHSVRLNGLAIEKAVFCQGRDRFVYAKAIRADLFLSVNPQDVVSAISHGVPAATIVARRSESRGASNEIRLAFDGDSVLFDESSDALYKLVGLDRWRDHEETNAMVPLGDGPFRSVFEKLHQVRDSLGDDSKGLIRLALVTARGAPAHERAIQTLTSWGLSVDEAIFAAGMPKGPLLQAFGADFFFDDLASNIDSASSCSVPAGHVPFGNGGITV